MAESIRDNLQPAISRLREASRRTVRQLDFLSTEFGGTGCTHPQCHVLIELESRGLLTVGELAEILCQDKSTTSRTVGQLVRDGLVRAGVDRNDARCKPLTLTDRGRRKAARINELAQSQVAGALALLNAEEVDTVVEGMVLYAKALEHSRDQAGVEIRPIAPGDDPEIGTIIRQVMAEFGAVGCGFCTEDLEVDHMARAYAGERTAYFVAEHDRSLLGGAGIGPLAGCDDPAVCELRKMFLLPEGRGIGMGRRLLDLCLDAARHRGFRRIYLETLEQMVQARYLYEKYGFEPLPAPMGDTGHHGCNRWAILEL
jgi:putative acetyltransferase